MSAADVLLGDVMPAILCETADERPSVQSISELVLVADQDSGLADSS